MAFAAAYTAEIDDRRDRLVTVTLEQDGNEEAAEPFELAETPAVRQGSKSSSDELEPLRPQLVRLRVPPGHSGIIDAIYANSEGNPSGKAWRVRIEIEGQLDFYGPLRKNLRTRGIDLFQEPTELTANCGLGGLQGTPFRAADGSLLEEPDSIQGWIQFCLAKIGTGLPLATASNWFAHEMDAAADPLAQELIDPARYLDDDGKPLSCFAVLEDLTRGKGAVLTQEGGLWRFYQRARFYGAAASGFSHTIYQPDSSAGQSGMHQAVTEVPEPLSGRLEGALEPTRQSYGAVEVTYEHGPANLLPNPTLEFERGEGTTVRGYYRPGPFEDVEGWDFTSDVYVYENRGVESLRNTLAMPVREGGYAGQTVSNLLSSYLRMSRSMLVEQSTSPRLQIQVTCRPSYGPVRRGQGPSVDPYVLFGYLEVRLDASDDRTFWLYRPYEGEAEWVEGEERFVTCGAVLDEETEITLLTPELPADGAVTFAFREGIDAEAVRWEEEGREFYFPREMNRPAHYTPAARWLWHSASLAPAVGDPGEVEVNPAETIYTFADEAASGEGGSEQEGAVYEISVLHGSGPTGGHKGGTRAEAEPLPYPIAGLPPRLGALHTDWTHGPPETELSGLVAAQLLAREALLQLRRERAEIEATYGPAVDVSLVRAVREGGRVFLPVHAEYDYRECTTRVNAVEVLRAASVPGGYRVTRGGAMSSSSRAGSGTVSIVGRLGQLQQQAATSGAVALTGAPLTGTVDSIPLDGTLPEPLEVLRTGSLVTVSGRRGGAWQFTIREDQQASDTALLVESTTVEGAIPTGSGVFPSPGGVLSLITQHEDQIRDELIRDGDVVTSLVLDYAGLTLDGEKFVSDNFDGSFSADAAGLTTIASPGTEGYALTESGEAAFEGIYAREFITGADLTDAYSKAEADARYIEAAGDTMNGPLTLQDSLTLQGGGQLKGDGSGNVGVYAWDGTNFGTMVVKDLIVQGQVDQKNTNELAVADQYIVTNAGQTGAPSLNGGLRVERGDQADAYWAWEEGLDTWGSKMGPSGTFYPAGLRGAGLQQNLDADLLDGYHGAELGALAEEESVTAPWTFEQGLRFDGELRSENYASGFGGSGVQLRAADGSLEVSDLSVRETLLARSLEVRKLAFSKGPLGITPGAGTVSSATSTGTDYKDDPRYFVTFEESHGCTAGDYLLAQTFDPASGAAITQSRLSVNVRESATQMSVGVLEAPDGTPSDPPARGTEYIVAASGDPDRDSLLYLDPYGPHLDVLDGLSDFSDWDARSPKVRLGRIDDMPDVGDASPAGFGLWGENVYLQNAHLDGTIYATAGEIASWSILGETLRFDLEDGSMPLTLGRSLAGASDDVELRVSLDGLGTGTNNYVRLFHGGELGDPWGLEGVENGQPVFSLGETQQIAGWSFDSQRLLGGNLALRSAGAVEHTGGAWALNGDGSGQLASGAIDWAPGGGLTVRGNIAATNPLSISDDFAFIDTDLWETLGSASGRTIAGGGLRADSTVVAFATRTAFERQAGHTLSFEIVADEGGGRLQIGWKRPTGGAFEDFTHAFHLPSAGRVAVSDGGVFAEIETGAYENGDVLIGRIRLKASGGAIYTLYKNGDFSAPIAEHSTSSVGAQREFVAAIRPFDDVYRFTLRHLGINNEQLGGLIAADRLKVDSAEIAGLTRTGSLMVDETLTMGAGGTISGEGYELTDDRISAGGATLTGEGLNFDPGETERNHITWGDGTYSTLNDAEAYVGSYGGGVMRMQANRRISISVGGMVLQIDNNPGSPNRGLVRLYGGTDADGNTGTGTPILLDPVNRAIYLQSVGADSNATTPRTGYAGLQAYTNSSGDTQLMRVSDNGNRNGF